MTYFDQPQFDWQIAYVALQFAAACVLVGGTAFGWINSLNAACLMGHRFCKRVQRHRARNSRTVEQMWIRELEAAD